MTSPEGWKPTALGSVLERVKMPVNVELSREYREIGIRSHGKGVFHKSPVTGEGLGDKRVFWVVPDALVLNIVFAWEQAVAVTSYKEAGMIASHRFPMYLPANGKCDIHFLMQFFKTRRGKDLLGIASPGGAGRNKTLGQHEFERLRISLPDRSEQARIAHVLAISDLAIEAAIALSAATRKQHDGLSRMLLTGKLRLPGFKKTWTTRSIKQMGKVVAGGTPDTSLPKNWGGPILWATPSDIAKVRGRYIKKTQRNITELGLQESAAFLLPVGSLLVCTRATICELAISAIEMATNQGFKSVVPANSCDVEFLYHLFRLNKPRFIRMSCGSTFLELSKRDFERMNFLVPDHDEQVAIAKRINAAEDQVTAVNTYIEHLRKQKLALMQQLLTGKRRLLREPMISGSQPK